MEKINDELPVITLVDEEGNPSEFGHVLTFMYENERYMALAPTSVADDADEAEEVEIVFMHVVKAGGEDALELVDNEVLLDELFEVFCELMDEDEEDPEGGEEADD
ncbi:MAG: DUF1292 domain-containing protein [Clostridia bacterium]|nr:DUF1292 domain-containing protein [Clostridia bacterium]